MIQPWITLLHSVTPNDPHEALPPEDQSHHSETPETIQELYDQCQMEDDENYSFDRIVDHTFCAG